MLLLNYVNIKVQIIRLLCSKNLNYSALYFS